MYAPKPAICGNGHAAMQRTYNVDRHLMVDEKKSQNNQTKKTTKPKSKH